MLFDAIPTNFPFNPFYSLGRNCENNMFNLHWMEITGYFNVSTKTFELHRHQKAFHYPVHAKNMYFNS